MVFFCFSVCPAFAQLHWTPVPPRPSVEEYAEEDDGWTELGTRLPPPTSILCFQEGRGNVAPSGEAGFMEGVQGSKLPLPSDSKRSQLDLDQGNMQNGSKEGCYSSVLQAEEIVTVVSHSFKQMSNPLTFRFTSFWSFSTAALVYVSVGGISRFKNTPFCE